MHYLRRKTVFKIAASIRAGINGFDCNECTDYDKEQLACEKISAEPIWSDENDDFYNCPFHFISYSTFDLLSRYDAIKQGWALPLSYDKTLNRFVEAIEYYEKQYNKFYNQKHHKASE